MKISTEHRDALNEALDETAGYEGDVYVFDVKHIEILRSAVIAMLEAQIATVAPAVDAPTDDWDTERLDAAIRDYATVVRMAQLPQHGGMQRELRQTRLRIHEIAKSVFASSPKPAVDAQPVAWRHKATKILRNDSIAKGADFEPADWEPLYTAAQSEGLRKDAERLDWLDRNMFHREMNEWDTRIHHGETMWVMFAPNGVQGSARNVIDAVLPQHNTGEKYD